MKTILFVTSNSRKVEDYNRRFAKADYLVEQLNIDLNEGRSLDIQEITKLKLDQAKIASKNNPVFVEDRGFFIPTLNGFPGPFVKLFLKSIGIEGVIDLMKTKNDREAKFVSVLGFWDGENEYFFEEIEEGFITNDIRKGDIRGWTEILNIYGHSSFPGKALSELSDNEWEKYLSTIEKNDYINKFIRFLINR